MRNEGDELFEPVRRDVLITGTPEEVSAVLRKLEEDGLEKVGRIEIRQSPLSRRTSDRESAA